MKPTLIEIEGNFYQLPSLDYCCLRLTTDAGTVHTCKANLESDKVEVPPGGILVEFMTGGGRHEHPPLRIRTKPEYQRRATTNAKQPSSKLRPGGGDEGTGRSGTE